MASPTKLSDLERYKFAFRDIRSWKDVRLWWESNIDPKVKNAGMTLFCLGFVAFGFQYQVWAQTDARINGICEVRNDGLTDLHDVLYEVVDLSDIEVLRNDPNAAQYTANRRKLVDQYVDNAKEEGCVG